MKNFLSNFSPITWKIGIALISVSAMYVCAMMGVPFPDGLSTIVGLSVGFMFRDPETRGWRGVMGAIMFILTMAIWIAQQTLYQEALLGMAFGNLYKNSEAEDKEDDKHDGAE